MTDVRSLLRNERASRRINHPQATYTTTGRIVCLVCRTQLKSESLWDTHLKSAPHGKRLQSIRDGASKPATDNNGTRKRKADDEDEDSRKKTKPVEGLPDGFFDENVKADIDPPPESAEEETHEEPALAEPALAEQQTHSSGLPAGFFDPSTKPPPVPTTAIDENEWAAFERDIATPPPQSLAAPSALTATATISAAPLTAAELAARSREEASTQTIERREAELEGEREDAALRLEEEFEEMEGLEERVRRLREKREELRKRIKDEVGLQEVVEIMDGVKGAEGGGGGDEDADDDGDEWDRWGLP